MRLTPPSTTTFAGNFNPRTHVGCDTRGAGAPAEREISIHAPTWGATILRPILARSAPISIHAPTWGATLNGCKWCITPSFQSTHPRGVRPSGIKQPEATLHFNPRTHVGCDSKPEGCLLSCRHFNPRTHVGCDEMWGSAVPVRGHFNPRTHVGCDCCASALAKCLLAFQSTHPRGVRPIKMHGLFVFKKFQSTHPRGVRHLCTVNKKRTAPFQSTHPRGVRLLSHQMVGF